MATAIATPIANPRVEVVRRVTLAVANRAYGTSRRPRGACIDTEGAATSFGEPSRAPGEAYHHFQYPVCVAPDIFALNGSTQQASGGVPEIT